MLESIGVDSIKELSHRNAASLVSMIETRHGKVIGLSEAAVQGWIDEAKAFSSRRTGIFDPSGTRPLRLEAGEPGADLPQAGGRVVVTPCSESPAGRSRSRCRGTPSTSGDEAR